MEAAVCTYCKTPFIIEKAINQYNVEQAQIQADNVYVSNGPQASSLISRARILCEDGKFDEAYKLINEALKMQPESGEAYVTLLMIWARVGDQKDLSKTNTPLSIDAPLSKSEYYKRAIQFSDEKTQAFLRATDEKRKSELRQERPPVQRENEEIVQRIRQLEPELERITQEGCRYAEAEKKKYDSMTTHNDMYGTILGGMLSLIFYVSFLAVTFLLLLGVLFAVFPLLDREMSSDIRLYGALFFASIAAILLLMKFGGEISSAIAGRISSKYLENKSAFEEYQKQKREPLENDLKSLKSRQVFLENRLRTIDGYLGSTPKP
jgi:tetratricopeptide (TPR) repeat protein